MFVMGTPAWGIVVRTLLVYLAVFLGLRLAGKRELGQMTVFDLVVILLIANAVQNAMVGPDVSVQGGILAAIVLLAANWLVAFLRLHRGVWGRLIEGTPTVLIENGDLIEPHLRKERVEREELEMVMREHGRCLARRGAAGDPGDGRIDQHRPQGRDDRADTQARSADPEALILLTVSVLRAEREEDHDRGGDREHRCDPDEERAVVRDRELGGDPSSRGSGRRRSARPPCRRCGRSPRSCPRCVLRGARTPRHRLWVAEVCPSITV